MGRLEFAVKDHMKNNIFKNIYKNSSKQAFGLHVRHRQEGSKKQIDFVLFLTLIVDFNAIDTS